MLMGLCQPLTLRCSLHSQEGEENMHASTHKAITMVQEKIQSVSDTYQQLMTTCQQKRNLFTVCVKFHMSVRQVRPSLIARLILSLL